MKVKDVRVKDVPDDLHKAFKSRCALEGESMNDVMIRLITKYTNEKGEKHDERTRSS